MDKDLEKDSYIEVVLSAESIKVAFEILCKITTRVNIRFDPDGFSMVGVSGDVSLSPKKGKRKTISKSPNQSDYVFPKEQLNRYVYNLHTGVKPYPSYEVEVIVKDLLNNIKNLQKNKLEFHMAVDRATGKNGGIFIAIPETMSGRKKVPTYLVKGKVQHTDYYNKFYFNTAPQAKPFLAMFGSNVKGCKQAECSELEFCSNIVTGKTFMYGWKNDQDDAPIVVPLTNDDDEDDSDINNKNRVKVSISLHDSPWILKISKLAPQAVLQVYLKEDAPLVIRTWIGNQGTATFAFPNESEKKRHK